MATSLVCYPEVRGSAARFTRLDGCGCPQPGLCNIIVANDIVTINATAEVEEGEEILVRNMNGAICVQDKPCDSIKWFTLEVTMCKTIPQLFSLVSGSPTAYNADGQVVGFGIGTNVDCARGFSLEVWLNVPGQACVPGQAGGQWGYMIFPWVSAATLTGDIEIGNSARQPVLRGRTKVGHCWGVGPYAVQNNAIAGQPVQPGPLITPIPTDQHVWDVLVSIPPPTAGCECEDLLLFCTAQIYDGDPTGQTVRFRWGAISGTVSIDWGDGSVDTVGGPSGDVLHQYLIGGTPPIPDTFTITLTNTDGETERVCSATFSTAPLPVIEEDEDDVTGRTAGVRVDNRHGSPSPGSPRPAVIDWGDGSPKTEVTGTPAVAPAYDATHAYAAPGVYTVTFCDKAVPSRCYSTQVTIPFV